MIKTFKIEYDFETSVTVEVDEAKVAEYEWQGKKRCLWTEMNSFWSGDTNRLHDANGDVREATLKLLGETAILECVRGDYNEAGLIRWFGNAEGWCAMDGSYGIKIVDVVPFCFDEDDYIVTEMLELERAS